MTVRLDNLTIFNFHKKRAGTISLLDITNDLVNNENMHYNWKVARFVRKGLLPIILVIVKGVWKKQDLKERF